MLKLLNFLYKGFAFADPRFGVKETFWVFIFSVILSVVDTIVYFGTAFIPGFTVSILFALGPYIVFYPFISFTVRYIPFFVIKPFKNKKFSAIYVVDHTKKYWLNAIIAMFLCFVFLTFPIWLLSIFIVYFNKPL